MKNIKKFRAEANSQLRKFIDELNASPLGRNVVERSLLMYTVGQALALRAMSELTWYRPGCESFELLTKCASILTTIKHRVPAGPTVLDAQPTITDRKAQKCVNSMARKFLKAAKIRRATR